MDRNMDVKDTAKDIKKTATSAGRDVKNMVSDFTDKIPRQITERFDSVRESADMVLTRAESLVRKYPFYSVLGAAAIGLLAAKLFSSKSESFIYEE